MTMYDVAWLNSAWMKDEVPGMKYSSALMPG